MKGKWIRKGSGEDRDSVWGSLGGGFGEGCLNVFFNRITLGQPPKNHQTSHANTTELHWGNHHWCVVCLVVFWWLPQCNSVVFAWLVWWFFGGCPNVILLKKTFRQPSPNLPPRDPQTSPKGNERKMKGKWKGNERKMKGKWIGKGSGEDRDRKWKENGKENEREMKGKWKGNE